MKLDKKYFLRAAIIIPFILGVAYIYYRTPKLVKIEYDGIYYQLGNPDFSEKTTVIFDGYLTRGLGLEDTFQGTIIIGEDELTKVDLRIPKDSQAPVIYYNDVKDEYITYGSMYSKDIKKSFTLCVFYYDETEDTDKWSSADGYMISAPAEDRSEALELTNELVKEQLQKELK